MSGPFEKYVAQAAEALARSTAHVAPTTHPWEGMSKAAKERNEIHAAAVLAAVGPLIQEDTRDRMVTAAAASLDRDGGGEESVHKPFPDDGVTYCGWDKHEGCGEVWPCSTVRARGVGERS